MSSLLTTKQVIAKLKAIKMLGFKVKRGTETAIAWDSNDQVIFRALSQRQESTLDCSFYQ